VQEFQKDYSTTKYATKENAMSGSKECDWSLAEEVTRQFRAMRQAAERAENARRAAEQARRLQERIDQTRADAVRESLALNGQIESFARGESADFAREQVNTLHERIRNLRTELASASDLPSLKNIVHALSSTSNELRRVVKEGDAARKAALLKVERDRCAALLDNVATQVADLDQNRSRRFDALGLQRANAALCSVREQLKKASGDKDFQAVQAATADAERVLHAHLAAVEQGVTVWYKRASTAEAELAAVRDHLQCIAKDPVMLAWVQKEIQTLETQANAIDAVIKAERFDDAGRACQSILKKAGESTTKAQAQQLLADQHRHAVDSLIGALKKEGFDVQAPSASETGPEARIVARKPNTQKNINLSVNQNGHICCTAPGYGHKKETSNGTLADTCDEAITDIQKLQQHMADDGVNTSAVSWRGMDINRKPPSQIKKAQPGAQVQQRPGQQQRRLSR
jgi:hypothetical protein